MTKTYSERVEEVDVLTERVWKLRALSSKIQKPEIKDKFKKYVDKLQTTLGEKAILLQNMQSMQKVKDEIKSLKRNIKTIQNSKTRSCAHNLQAKLHDKREELNDLETHQFMLELPEKQRDLNCLFSKMKGINEAITLAVERNQDNNIAVNQHKNGFKGFIMNSNSNNERGLG
jgi:hypothetical protein